MSGQTSFWRNLTMIGAAHAVILVGLARWSASAKKPAASDIVWMDGGGGMPTAMAFVPATAPPATAEPDQLIPVVEEALPEPQTPSPPGDVELPTPAPVSTPRPTPPPVVTPKKSTPKPTPKKALVVKRPTPATKPVATPRKKAVEVEATTTTEPSPAVASDPTAGESQAGPGTGAAGGGRGSGPAGASQFGWYRSMLHDRFFSEWVQPTSVLASGAKMSVLVRLRIEKDGHVSNFAVVRPSGNVVVDESVAAVAKRVAKVDPLPAGLSGAGHYDVNINFELNPE